MNFPRRLFLFLFSLSSSLLLLFLLGHRRARHRPVQCQVRSSSCQFKTADDFVEFGISIGTLVRGDEWKAPVSEKKKAVLTSLFSLSHHFGDNNMVLLADSTLACETLPAFLRRSRCSGLEHCMHSKYASPTMDCIFSTLWSLAKHDVLGFINGDILVFDSFFQSIVSCEKNYDNFVMVGRRHISEIAMSAPTTNSEWAELEAHTESLNLDGGAAIDFFVTRRSAISIIKDFPPSSSECIAGIITYCCSFSEKKKLW